MKPDEPGSRPEWVMSRMKSYCALQERCISEVKEKLQEFRLQPRVESRIISRLIGEDFLNEERFVRAFAGGKFRMKQWGRLKIIRALARKGVPEILIELGLREIGDQEYISTLKKLISARNKDMKETSILIRNRKLANFAISRGFEPELVWDVLNFRD
ncbi:MAG: RecX family transcriptional regulator [Bacteroidales bacterium]|nr:RecX family transcriptional regulator [Bacteroidales bacterium]